jgi:hypothetical protein
MQPLMLLRLLLMALMAFFAATGKNDEGRLKSVFIGQGWG